MIPKYLVSLINGWRREAAGNLVAAHALKDSDPMRKFQYQMEASTLDSVADQLEEAIHEHEAENT